MECNFVLLTIRLAPSLALEAVLCVPTARWVHLFHSSCRIATHYNPCVSGIDDCFILSSIRKKIPRVQEGSLICPCLLNTPTQKPNKRLWQCSELGVFIQNFNGGQTGTEKKEQERWRSSTEKDPWSWVLRRSGKFRFVSLTREPIAAPPGYNLGMRMKSLHVTRG